LTVSEAKETGSQAKPATPVLGIYTVGKDNTVYLEKTRAKYRNSVSNASVLPKISHLALIIQAEDAFPYTYQQSYFQ